MSTSPTVQTLTVESAGLGESPLWHRAGQAFYWVDILGHQVFRISGDTGRQEVVHSGLMVTAIGETTTGGLVMVTPEGLLSFEGGTVSVLADLTLDPRVRTNDGKCDPGGRLWFGTMDYDARNPIAALYRYDGDRIDVVTEGLILSNGLGWSPTRDTMYHVDSIRRQVYAYGYDDDTGQVSNRTVFCDMSDWPGVPDGLSVDVDGNLWVAIYDGWCIRVIDPGGRRTDEVQLEVQKPTSVAFGGPDLSRLYVTTASQDLSPDEFDAQPDAGNVLTFDPGISGLAPGRFVV